MKAYLFPGQGAQKKGMGADIFDRYPEYITRADQILGYSLRELCLEDPHNQLGQTQFTQPALFTVSALTYQARCDDGQPLPDFLAGHSLGEYTALFAAGAYDFDTGLKLVQKRGQLMSEAQSGGMAAVIGLDETAISRILTDNDLQKISIANFNSPEQIVLSGDKEQINRAQEIFTSQGAKTYIVLKVSGAFHSPYMQSAADQFTQLLANIEVAAPRIPIISNVTARIYDQDVKQLLSRQFTHSVKWTESIRYLMGKGVTEFEEVGPGVVLSNLVRKIKAGCTPLVVDEEKSIPAESDAAVSSQGGETNVAFQAEKLGSASFRQEYGVRYAYYAGAMFRGIASRELVVALANAGLMGSLGTGGLGIEEIEKSLQFIREKIKPGAAFIVNLLNNIAEPQLEEDLINLYLRYGVTIVEAAAFMQISLPLVMYRLKGLEAGKDGKTDIKYRIIAKVSRPEIAAAFLAPAPQRIIKKLLAEGKVTEAQAALASSVPMADDICVEADSGGHTDMGVAYTLMPAMLQLRDEMVKKYGYNQPVRVGAAGGIGTPQAAAAAFMLGADFIVTGSINQCTVEAGQSEVVKEMLQTINVQDTDYAPAGDMFEMGAKVQVLRKGVFFPARANRLFEVYRQYNSLDEIDEKTRTQIEQKYFKRSFDEIWAGTRDFFQKTQPQEVVRAEQNAKYKMSLVFRWYFHHTTQVTLKGDLDYKVDFQVHCGPCLGAFNQWVKNTPYETWQSRKVVDIADFLMSRTAGFLEQRFAVLQQK